MELLEFLFALLLVGNVCMGADDGADLAEPVPGADAARHDPAPGAVLVLHAEDVVVERYLLHDVLAAHFQRLGNVVDMDQRHDGFRRRVHFLFAVAQHRLEFLRGVKCLADEIQFVQAVIDPVHDHAKALFGLAVFVFELFVFGFQLDDRYGADQYDTDAEDRADDQDVDEIGLL